MFVIVFLYSSFVISPVQTPGHKPICLLKHGLHRRTPSVRRLRDAKCPVPSWHGTHLSRNGKILRTNTSASLITDPLGNGPNCLSKTCPTSDVWLIRSLPRTSRTRGKSSLVMTTKLKLL